MSIPPGPSMSSYLIRGRMRALAFQMLPRARPPQPPPPPASSTRATRQRESRATCATCPRPPVLVTLPARCGMTIPIPARRRSPIPSHEARHLTMRLPGSHHPGRFRMTRRSSCPRSLRPSSPFPQSPLPLPSLFQPTLQLMHFLPAPTSSQ